MNEPSMFGRPATLPTPTSTAPLGLRLSSVSSAAATAPAPARVVLRLPDLQYVSAAATIEQPAMISTIRVDAASRSAMSVAALQSPTAASNFRQRLAVLKPFGDRAVAAAQRVPDLLRQAAIALRTSSNHRQLAALLPSRAQFIAIAIILCTVGGLGLLLRGKHAASTSPTVDANVVATPAAPHAATAHMESPFEKFSRQFPSEPPAVKPAEPSTSGPMLGSPGGWTQPTTPSGFGTLPNATTVGQTFEATRPREGDPNAGRVIQNVPTGNNPSPRTDGVPYMPPRQPLVAQGWSQPPAAPVVSAPLAVEVSRMASRDPSPAVVTPQNPAPTAQPPVARLNGNIALPPMGSEYDRPRPRLY